MTQNRNVTLPPNNWAALAVTAEDAGSAPAAIHGTVTIDDYSKAYVWGNLGGFGIVPKVAAPVGGSFQVVATYQAFSENGTALDPVTLTATVQGAPDPTQASQLVVGSTTIFQNIDVSHGTPDDPGSAQVTF